MSDISMDVTGMETDYVVHSTGNPLLTNLPDDDKSLCYPTSRECSMLFEETTQQGSVGNVPTSQHSQDTGYQTCSLQLTGQDTGLHTNLTQQFGSLPFRSFSEADCMDEGIEQGNPLPKPVIFKERLEAVNTSMVSRQLSYPPTSKSAFTQQKVDCLQTKNYLKTELEGCALIQEGLTEDQVIAKARYLLGQTASVTSALPTKPSAELLGVSSQPDTTVPHLTWQPSCSSTPQKTISHSATAPSQPPSKSVWCIFSEYWCFIVCKTPGYFTQMMGSSFSDSSRPHLWTCLPCFKWKSLLPACILNGLHFLLIINSLQSKKKMKCYRTLCIIWNIVW